MDNVKLKTRKLTEAARLGDRWKHRRSGNAGRACFLNMVKSLHYWIWDGRRLQANKTWRALGGQFNFPKSALPQGCPVS